MKRCIAILALCSTLLTACWGSCGMTNKLYQWNSTMGNKWANWAVFLGLNIIPVYPVSLIIDALVLNTVEFYTGENPMASNQEIHRDYDGTVVVKRGDDVYHFVPTNDRLANVFRNGELLGTAELAPDGRAEVRDAEGTLVAAMPAELLFEAP